ncbi:MAG: hypothetical protein EXX96DRAFT_521367 [Benjaminiella poitrasii]|nr:MAG: hypothetical protein EXX96DRAFT_521367 [Benjaminiella poitrasii]
MTLTLSEKYALAWLQMSTITLFTMLGSLFYLKSSVSNHMEASKVRLESVCDSINRTSEQLYNAPSILYRATLTSMYTAKENIHQNLSTLINIVESSLVWIIRMYKSTYQCLLGLTIHTLLSLVSQIAGPIEKVANGVSSFLRLGDGNPVDWTTSLKDVQTRIDQWLSNENDAIRQVLDVPFNSLQAQLNSTFGSWTPPQFNNKTASSDLMLQQPCNTGELLDAFDQARHGLIGCIWILIVALLVAVVVCTLVNVAVIRFRHQRLTQARAQFQRQYDEKKSREADTALLLDRYLWSTSTVLPWEKREDWLHQMLHFMSQPMVLYCFFVGVGGLILVAVLIAVLKNTYQEIFNSLEAQAHAWAMNATSVWTAAATHQIEDINEWIGHTESNLNNHVFGVVQSSAVALNTTLAGVVDQVQNLIHTVLGGTLLEKPAKDLSHCLLLNKIENIEQGLTWIASHSFVRLSRIDAPQFDSLVAGPKMQDSIKYHMGLNSGNEGDSFITEQLESLKSFYYMLLILWGICLCISMGFQVKHRFFRSSSQHQ